MSHKFANAVTIDLRLPAAHAWFALATHLFGLVCAALAQGVLAVVVYAAVAGSGWLNWRRSRDWPWRWLIWQPSGAVWLVDRDRLQWPARWCRAPLITRRLIIAPLRAGGRVWYLLLLRGHHPEGCRRLAQRLRCEAMIAGEPRPHGS